MRVLVELDGTILLVRPSGEVIPLLPGGHPRPGCCHALARRSP